MKTAIIYTRVSTEEQVNGLSLTNQEDACNEYAGRNGFRIERLFREEGASAKTTDRKQLIELLSFCKKRKGTIDALIVWKVDRFARRAEDHLTLKAYLKRFGVKLISVTEPIEDSNTGRLMETILAGFAQFDNEVRTERAINGLYGRAEEGGWITTAPRGYLNARDAQKRPTLAVDPELAPIVTKVFQEYSTSNHTLKSISQYAYELGLRSRHGNRIHIQPIAKLLRNPAYKGFRRSKSTGGIALALHPPIVDEYTWEKVQFVLSGKKKEFKPQRDTDWPLRGFVTCGDCDNLLTGSNVKGRTKYYSKYHCRFCRKATSGKVNSIDREEMHQAFADLLKKIAPLPNHAKLFKRIVVAKWNDEYKEMSEEKRRVERELQQLETRRERVLDLFIDGSLVSEEKDAQFEKIDAERTILRLRRSDLEQSVDDREEVIEVAMDFMKNVSSYWLKAPLLMQQRFQRIIFPDGIRFDTEKGFGTAKLGHAYLLLRSTDEKDPLWQGRGDSFGTDWPQLKLHLLEIYHTIKETGWSKTIALAR